MEASLKYSAYIEKTKVLGPGLRFGLWVNGCCFSCENCIAQNFREGGAVISVEAIERAILSEGDITGITVSGGEPFLQPKALSILLGRIKQKKNLDVIVYTGFRYEDLLLLKRDAEQYINEEEKKYILLFLEQIDILIDGTYIKELDDGRTLIGSSNQTIRNLSGRYSDEEIGQIYNQKVRKVELVIKENKTLLVGVPDDRQAQLWKRMKREVLQ